MKKYLFIFLPFLVSCAHKPSEVSIYNKYLDNYVSTVTKFEDFYLSNKMTPSDDNLEIVRSAEINSSYIYFLSALKMAESGDIDNSLNAVILALNRYPESRDYIVLKICLLSIIGDHKLAEELNTSIKNDHIYDVFHKYLLRSFFFGFDSVKDEMVGSYGINYAHILSDLGEDLRKDKMEKRKGSD